MISTNYSQQPTSSMAFGACICPKKAENAIKGLSLQSQERAVKSMQYIDEYTRVYGTNYKITNVDGNGSLSGKLIDGVKNTPSIVAVLPDNLQGSVAHMEKTRSIYDALKQFVPQKIFRAKKVSENTVSKSIKQ